MNYEKKRVNYEKLLQVLSFIAIIKHEIDNKNLIKNE